MAQEVIEAFRQMCNNCEASKTSKYVGGQRFEARTMDAQNTWGARYLLLAQSQFLSNNMAVVVPNSLDGQEFNWRELLPGVVQSRATGGRRKDDCGKFDPQELKFKASKKRQNTELMYIDREICNPHFIGSKIQGGQDGYPNFIGSSQNRFQVEQNTNLATEAMVADFESMAYNGIDRTSVLGNWVGAHAAGQIVDTASMAPHFDGVMKQGVLQSRGAYYQVVEVTPTALAGNAKYFVSVNRQMTAAVASLDDLVTKVNSITIDATGKKPYSAQKIGATAIRLIANKAGGEVYGLDNILLYYSADGTINGCSDPMTPTVLSPAMPYAEQPLVFDHEAITEGNFLTKFKGYLKQILEYKSDRYRGQNPNLGREYIAIDPLMLFEYEYAQLAEWKATYNAAGYLSRLNQIFPDFIPYEPLRGTGLFFHTHEANLAFLTNVKSDSLGVNRVWYDQDCGTIKSQMEMLANVLVLDFSDLAMNTKGSAFESNLGEAYEPYNLSHIAETTRRDAIVIDNQFADDDGFYPKAEITVTDGGAATKDVNLVSISDIPSDDSVSAYEWTIHLVGGAAVQPASQVQDATVNMADADYATVSHVELKITLTGGDIERTFIPKEHFVDNS